MVDTTADDGTEHRRIAIVSERGEHDTLVGVLDDDWELQYSEWHDLRGGMVHHATADIKIGQAWREDALANIAWFQSPFSHTPSANA